MNKLKEKIAKLIHEWYFEDPHRRREAICRYGHETNCSRCQSLDEQISYERLSEIGR